MTLRTAPRAASALLAGGLLLLGACTPSGAEEGVPSTPPSADGPASGEPGEGASPGADAVSAEDVVESFPFVVGGGEVEVDVHPLVRSGESVVLTLDLRPTQLAEGDTDLLVDDVLIDGPLRDPVHGGAIRLVDLERKQVYLPGVDAEGRAVGSPADLMRIPGDGVRVQRAYAAPADAEELSLLFPSRFVETVPIIDVDVPAPGSPDGPAPDPSPEPLDLGAVQEAPVHDLEQFTRELDGAVQVIESTERVEVSLGGDVLFASSSADLAPAAQAALDAAAAHLEGHAPGTVDVVGHTDDVGDDASNQTLSEQRAAAVATALAERVDTSKYQLTPSGRGESEPLVANDTDAHRQLNRRVTLTLTSTVTERTEVKSEGELPPMEEGPVATGAEGVELGGPRPFTVVAPEARRVGGSLVVSLEVTAEDDEIGSGFGIGGLSSVFSYRGEQTNQPQHVFALTVLSGATAVYPYDYSLETGDALEEWRTLGDLDTLRRVDGGQTLTFTAVYPAITGAETIAVQVNPGLGAEAFRLTDIPVVEEQ